MRTDTDELFASTLLIANPVAQSGMGRLAAVRAEHLLRANFSENDHLELFLTESAGHAKDYVAERGSKYSCIIALGGDGIIHEVVNGMMAGGPECCKTLGVIPVGSGNDYAKTLGISELIDKAVIQLSKRKLRKADLGCCNGEYFTETVSFGLDAAIALGTVERRKKGGKKGTILYLEEGIDQLFHHLDNYDYELEILEGPAEDVGSYSGSDILLAVQNGPTYGGGFKVTPKASIEDGLLDICIAHGPIGSLAATGVFLSAKNGHHTGLKMFKFLRGSHLRLRFDHRPPCQIDGEPHIADEYDISVVPAAIRVLVA